MGQVRGQAPRREERRGWSEGTQSLAAAEVLGGAGWCWVVLVAVMVLESGSGVAPVKLAESSRVRGGSRGADEGQRNAGVLTAEWARRPWSPGALEGGHGGLGAPGRASAAHDSEGARHV